MCEPSVAWGSCEVMWTYCPIVYRYPPKRCVCTNLPPLHLKRKHVNLACRHVKSFDHMMFGHQCLTCSSSRMHCTFYWRKKLLDWIFCKRVPAVSTAPNLKGRPRKKRLSVCQRRDSQGQNGSTKEPSNAEPKTPNKVLLFNIYVLIFTSLC